jgi:hypothetical protein
VPGKLPSPVLLVRTEVPDWGGLLETLSTPAEGVLHGSIKQECHQRTVVFATEDSKTTGDEELELRLPAIEDPVRFPFLLEPSRFKVQRG